MQRLLIVVAALSLAALHGANAWKDENHFNNGTSFRRRLLQAQATAGDPHPYSWLLSQSVAFYDVQQSGVLPAWNRFRRAAGSFRGDAHLTDGDAIGRPGQLAGGYYDAGDRVKFHLPLTASFVNLGLAGLFYKEAFVDTPDTLGTTWDYLQRHMRWASDYLIKSHLVDDTPTATRVVTQVGDGKADHQYCCRPEQQTGPRPVTVSGGTTKAANIMGNMASVFAAAATILSQPLAACLGHPCRKHGIRVRCRRYHPFSAPCCLPGLALQETWHPCSLPRLPSFLSPLLPAWVTPAGNMASVFAAAATILSQPGAAQDVAFADSIRARAGRLLAAADAQGGAFSSRGFYESSSWESEVAMGYLMLCHSYKAAAPTQPAHSSCTTAIARYQGVMATGAFAYTYDYAWNKQAFPLNALLQMMGPSLVLADGSIPSASIRRAQQYMSEAMAWWQDYTSACPKPNFKICYTKPLQKSLAFLFEWGPLRYAANAAFGAMMHSSYLESQSLSAKQHRCFARRQLTYMLGDNPPGQVYVTGYRPAGKSYADRPHHAASVCSTDYSVPCGWTEFNLDTPSTYQLPGALVGGPDAYDYFDRLRTNYKSNEVALDYNAGFVGLLAGIHVASKKLEAAGCTWENYCSATSTCSLPTDGSGTGGGGGTTTPPLFSSTTPYAIRTQASYGGCLDNNAGTITLLACVTGKASQAFTMQSVGGTQYKLVSGTQCWGTSGGATSNGTPIVMEPCVASKSTQNFDFVASVTAGFYNVKPAGTSMCLEVGGTFTAGNVVKLARCSANSLSQQYKPV